MKNKEAQWWLDQWVWKAVAPLLRLFKDDRPNIRESPKKIKVRYGASEPCYCGSGSKYKNCCKKVNKQSGKVALKIITNGKKGQKIKVKVVNEIRLPKKGIFQDYGDSGMNVTDFNH